VDSLPFSSLSLCPSQARFLHWERVFLFGRRGIQLLNRGTGRNAKGGGGLVMDGDQRQNKRDRSIIRQVFPVKMGLIWLRGWKPRPRKFSYRPPLNEITPALTNERAGEGWGDGGQGGIPDHL
jgi:hypothetical protein